MWQRNALAAKLREGRATSKLSRAQLADLSCVSERTIRAIEEERYIRPPCTRTIIRLVSVLLGDIEDVREWLNLAGRAVADDELLRNEFLRQVTVQFNNLSRKLHPSLYRTA